MVEPRPLLTAVVATPETGSAGIFIVMDLLSSVGRFWEMLHGETERPRFEPRLVTFDGEPYEDLHGVTIRPHGALADIVRPDIVIVPELAIDPWQPLPNSFAAIADWLRESYEQGAVLASLCSGSVLISETGLLDGEEATSHWAYCDVIKARHPEIIMRKERVLVPSGPEHRLITTGGFATWHDLLLYLVGRLVGAEEARQLAKCFLLDWHMDGQLPFAALTVGRKHDDAVVSAAQVWAAHNYADANPVAAMAQACGLTERSLHRRFRKATGQSPLEYVQTLRIEEAKQMLETTDMPPEDIALEVGYTEPSAFRHLFRRLVGVTPSAYRRKHQRVEP